MTTLSTTYNISIQIVETSVCTAHSNALFRTLDACSMHEAWPPDIPMAIAMSQYSLHVNSVVSLALLSSARSLDIRVVQSVSANYLTDSHIVTVCHMRKTKLQFCVIVLNGPAQRLLKAKTRNAEELQRDYSHEYDQVRNFHNIRPTTSGTVIELREVEPLGPCAHVTVLCRKRHGAVPATKQRQRRAHHGTCRRANAAATRQRVASGRPLPPTIGCSRPIAGAFVTLYSELRGDEKKFFNYFRMTRATFDELLNRLSPVLAKHNSEMRDAISPTEQLAVSLSIHGLDAMRVNKVKIEYSACGTGDPRENPQASGIVRHDFLHVETVESGDVCESSVARLWVKWRLCVTDSHQTALRYLYVETASYMVQSEWNKFAVMVLKAMVGFPTLEGAAAPLAVIHGDGVQFLDLFQQRVLPHNPYLELLYLASDNSFTGLHYVYRCGVSTISEIVNEACEALWDKLLNECIPPLDRRKTHICCQRLLKQNTWLLVFNYKDYFSIVVLAVADIEYRFIFVNVGAYVFKNSSLWKSIINKNDLPTKPKPLPARGKQRIPLVFVGDEGFGVHQHLVWPYIGKLLNQRKRIFNYRLSRARMCVECAFGLLIFNRPLNVSTDLAMKIIQACCILHDFVRERDGYAFEETLTVVVLEDIPDTRAERGNVSASDIRLLHYPRRWTVPAVGKNRNKRDTAPRLAATDVLPAGTGAYESRVCTFHAVDGNFTTLFYPLQAGEKRVPHKEPIYPRAEGVASQWMALRRAGLKWVPYVERPRLYAVDGARRCSFQRREGLPMKTNDIRTLFPPKAGSEMRRKEKKAPNGDGYPTRVKVGVKHVHTEVDFATGTQFVSHALGDSQPIVDWKSAPRATNVPTTGGALPAQSTTLFSIRYRRSQDCYLLSKRATIYDELRRKLAAACIAACCRELMTPLKAVRDKNCGIQTQPARHIKVVHSKLNISEISLCRPSVAQSVGAQAIWALGSNPGHGIDDNLSNVIS
ncbi:hypothetical protein PR048_023058 [Dryococelus australis]|uniref:DDE Tnp4 domain-containing protein n=1 Tax=Dryococelus australis TaxID=614101 RepID=A0ABQ9GT31_9NEOP|nr:hypothetical protein PR048_023058 [Dryococelus australis]